MKFTHQEDIILKKKMILIVAIVVALIAAIVLLNNMKNSEKLVDNPYGTDKLSQPTIDLLNNPLYDNIIVPEDLDKKLADGETITVYYFSPTCSYCVQTTPIVVPLLEELEIDMVKMNLLEFDKTDHYEIKGTPTIIHYVDGIEVGRISGLQDEETFRQFFGEVVLSNEDE